MNIINICIYVMPEEKDLFAKGFGCLTDYSRRKLSFDYYEQYDTYIEALKNKHCDAIFVATDNADGMEGVIAAKSVCADKPVVWLSNDKGFGAQSYRLGCVYFAKKNFTHEQLATALSHCFDV